MPEVADVLRRYGREYLDRCEQDLLPSHRRAMDDIIHCRTEALGGHLLQCDHCGQEHDVYHSCRNRSCPKCHHQDTEAGLADRRRELLPVPYFHVGLTLPQELREIVRRHQRDLYDISLRAAARALITLAYHPPVHCLVPAGGVSVDRTEWRPARPSSLVPVHALAKLFRGLLLDLVRQERPDLPLPEAAWTKGWGVHCQPTVQGPEQVLNYLGRYVHRIALTNRRILSSDNGHVCFRYQDAQDHRWKSMTLPALEFIRRFLQHVLPEGFHKVRYYGLWSPLHRSLLHQLQLWLARHDPVPPLASPAPELQAPASWCPPLRAGHPCPSCGQGLLVVIRLLPRPQRGPP